MALELLHDADLSQLNSFGVAARAARMITIDANAAVDDALALVPAIEPRLVLGGGSNVLFTRDFEGTILRVRTRGREILAGGRPGEALVFALAGESWTEFVRWTLSERLYGLENLSLIPGTVGAAPVQNIGAYGIELKDRFESLDAVDLVTGRSVTLGAATGIEFQSCRPVDRTHVIAQRAFLCAHKAGRAIVQRRQCCWCRVCIERCERGTLVRGLCSHKRRLIRERPLLDVFDFGGLDLHIVD